MEYIYSVYEFGSWEFVGTMQECIAYVESNQFKDSFFEIKAI